MQHSMYHCFKLLVNKIIIFICSDEIIWIKTFGDNFWPTAAWLQQISIQGISEGAQNMRKTRVLARIGINAIIT